MIEREKVNTVLYVHDDVVHNYSAATEVLPLLFDLYKPDSILDVGCGIGTWLKVAQDLGVHELKGVDGTYVNKSLLKIDRVNFIEHDLNTPLSLGQKFDLVICLEVAEHLPESSAKVLVQSLVEHADVILFSAAIPGQQGQNHLNEQWPEYWRAIFREYNFDFADCFRSIIWLNKSIEWWYRQNMFLVINKAHPLASLTGVDVMPLVHPELFKAVVDQSKQKVMLLRSELNRERHSNLLKRAYHFILGKRSSRSK